MDALVTAARNGDKEAFVQLIRMNKQSMYKTAWVYLRNEQDIADALQNMILSCYENIQGLREVKYFKTWLMRILINECKDILRQKNHGTELDNFAEGVHCEELDLCEWKQLLLCLDEESRKIVELYYFDEFSVKEISALLEMNSNTVSTKLSRARAKLKEEMCIRDSYHIIKQGIFDIAVMQGLVGQLTIQATFQFILQPQKLVLIFSQRNFTADMKQSLFHLIVNLWKPDDFFP